jgi:hypothetical protein
MNKNSEALNQMETPIFSKRASKKRQTSFGPGGVQASAGGSIDKDSSIWSEPKKVQFL